MSNPAPHSHRANYQSYEEEQLALRREFEGKGKDITIQPPKAPEVNPEVYRDVLPMIFRGFVTVAAKIGEAHFVFKSLNQHEFDMLRMMGVMEGSSYKSWDTLLAYNVLLIDGQNVLSERERWVPKISETFSQMDRKPRERIIRQMSEINRRANNATILAEAYFLESYSRYRWAQLHGMDLCSTAVTGFVGTEKLGMNWAQLTWRALNYYEDVHDANEREWENAKFVGSCMAGKGIQKVYQQDNDRRQKEREERVARKDRLLRQVIMGEKTDEKVRQLPGSMVTGAHTVEELAQQLESDLRGEKDWHDRVVEEHTNRIRSNIQGRQEQVRQLVRRHEQEFDGKKLLGATDFTGLSITEVQERITRRKQIEAQQASARMVRPEILADPKSRQFMDKWGITAPDQLPPGQAAVDFSVQTTSQDPSAAVPIQPPRRGVGVPFGRRR